MQLSRFHTLIGFIAAGMSAVMLFAIHSLPFWLEEAGERQQLIGLFFMLTIVWLLLIYALYALTRKALSLPKETLWLSQGTALAFLGITSLVEWELLKTILLLVNAAAVAFFFGFVPLRDEMLSYHQKAVRRIVIMILVFDMYAIMTTIFALNVFFQNSVPFWLLTFLVSLLFGIVAGLIWVRYTDKSLKVFFVPMLIVSIIMLELISVVELLPLGYLALGLAVTWPWYLLQLLLRFHLMAGGIVWSRQRVFLILNAVLYFLLFGLIVRWL